MSIAEQTKKIHNFIQENPIVDEISDFDILYKIYWKLIDIIVDHNHLYYINNEPIISDWEYDQIFAYLKKIEELHPELISSNSPTQWLVGQISEGFAQARHVVKLASLENSYNAQDLLDWAERVKKLLEKSDLEDKNVLYSIEPKFDGLSVELIYRDGKLSQAITRGDGRVGEDITQNIKTIQNLPQKLEWDLLHTEYHFRWEVLMPKSVWKDLNKEREANGETPFANTRNATAGSIKLLDSREVAKRWLVCYVYDILNDDIKELGVEQLKKRWLPVFADFGVFEDIADVVEICQNPQTKDSLDMEDIDFDGLVIKVKDASQRQILWSTDHHPRRAIAFKFPAQLASTQILSVDFQIWRTGILTPVANLEAVELSGVTIKRVSLHNIDFIKEKDLHIGDFVRIQRSGEVIPYIIWVIKERRQKSDLIPISMPNLCPSCNSKIRIIDIHHYCINPKCPAKLKEQILHFVSKNCMDIQWVWESIVDILVEQNIVQNVADIYQIPEAPTQILLRKFPGIWEKKLAEITKEIEESKKQPLWRLINWLWIPHIGKKMAQDIVHAMSSQQPVCLEDILQILVDEDFLKTVYGIWEKTLKSLIEYFSDPKIQEMLIYLRNIGMSFEVDTNGFNLFKEGKWVFSITGTFPISRDKVVDLLEKEWYVFQDNPNKNTNFILIWEKAGSKKAKAEKLWLKIYQWRDQIKKQFPILETIKTDDDKPQFVQESLF